MKGVTIIEPIENPTFIARKDLPLLVGMWIQFRLAPDNEFLRGQIVTVVPITAKFSILIGIQFSQEMLGRRFTTDEEPWTRSLILELSDKPVMVLEPNCYRLLNEYRGQPEEYITIAPTYAKLLKLPQPSEGKIIPSENLNSALVVN